METIEELKNRIQELSKQAVELRRKASVVYQINPDLAKHFRKQAREAMKLCQVFIQELKR
ncbi:MAG: hypothetical protein H0X31_08675 [Nostocaceae cyanobacterium]|nr:hypothetical protein [Nostocaceae cyanobacterium]